jgi:chromosome partitioning protein
MGTIYAIANQKGGVGKTTTAVNVAACIAAAGYQTLVVDVDPQGNATVGLGVARRHPGVYEVLSATSRRATPCGRPASSTSRSSSPRRISRARRWSCRARPLRSRLREALGAARRVPPSSCSTARRRSARSTVNALVAADRVIVPVQTEYFALEGLAGLLTRWR